MDLPTVDPRDPDRNFTFFLRLRYNPEDWRAIRADPERASDQPSVLMCPAKNAGRPFAATLCFQAEVAGMHGGEIGSTPLEIGVARAHARKWWVENLRLPPGDASDPALALYAKAGGALLQNSCRAGGRLRHGVASFPSRGTYPCHYFWDSMFQNLGLIHVNPNLARDALLLLIENIEPDGKVPHFICTTWNRPGSSQSPLLGWGVWNYIVATGDQVLARRALPALERNIEWWLSIRDPRGTGLAECADPFEIWDDTPRLDHGPIHPVDINAYLAIQMKVCAKLAVSQGDSAKATLWRQRYQSHIARLHDRLYCSRDNLYYDRVAGSDELLRLKTPASFMPLLLMDLPLGMERRKDMIRRYLLSPRFFYGAVPFPVVAYDELTYQPDKWWRGPMWPPISCLMLEVLQRNGFDAEHHAAVAKLHASLLADGEFHELFHSQTGAGLGATEQGWTAGIYIHLWHLLNDDLSKNGKEHAATKSQK